jgi:hypothetical protein
VALALGQGVTDNVLPTVSKIYYYLLIFPKKKKEK